MTLDDCSGGSPYVAPYSIGFNNSSNPNLKPEKSQSFTAGVVFEPARWLSVSVDYYNIKKTDVISGAADEPALVAYYSGDCAPRGLYSVTWTIHDPAFPNAMRQGADRQFAVRECGSADHRRSSMCRQRSDFRLSGLQWTSHGEVTDIIRYNFKGGCHIGPTTLCRHPGAIHSVVGRGHAEMARQLDEQL